MKLAAKGVTSILKGAILEDYDVNTKNPATLVEYYNQNRSVTDKSINYLNWNDLTRTTGMSIFWDNWSKSITRKNRASKEGSEQMDDNEWAKQYIQSVDRNISEIRQESNENRREIKSEIHSYIQEINNKFSIVMDDTRTTRREIKDEIKEIKDEYTKARDIITGDNKDTRKWIVGVGIGVIVAVVGSLVGLAITIINYAPK